MTVRVNTYRGDGTYYLCDAALELDGLRDGPAGRVVVGRGTDAPTMLVGMLARATADGPAALDVIVAAPKPVSLLLALEPDHAARGVVALHERSVDAAVSYLVDESLDAGSPRPPIVAFTHGVNRQLDPHLHTHVLVAAHDNHGEPVALGAVRSHAATADALYCAELRAGVESAVGRRAWRTGSGRTMVEGVDYALVAHTSAARDRSGRVEREQLKPHPTRAQAQVHWRSQLERHETLTLDLAVPSASNTIDEYRFARELGGSYVRGRDVVRAWAEACTTGELAANVRAATARVTRGFGPDARTPAVVVRDAAGVRVLGPRPRDPGALESWCSERAALERYLAGGHRLSHALDPRGAPASTRLALATLDAARTRGAHSIDPARARSRALDGRTVS